jgi:tetratricopeptide (TPR) repeat protein/tRNA A-37 threonylcarbamoyl transferase component Bud32
MEGASRTEVMAGDRHQRLAEIFLAACDLPAAERGRYLDGSCAGDAALRAEVESLLARDARQADLLDHPLPSPAVPAADPLIGRRVGRYHVKTFLGLGGLGRVYAAVQERPHRIVALKVMRPGIASGSALRRFEFEAQALARLRHPGVAEVYEAGTWDDGSGGVPWFAMEYIPNARTITAFARQKDLGTRERLQLFIRVCEAVDHGHQKGIIHRDLKPDNILIDPRGDPKIIDFGVARATDSDMAVTTLQTDIGQLIGTLQYMSPEQCAADPHDIDTRSDVYALGVVLYELLCGRTPYDVARLAIHEAARTIREQAPARPSTIDRALRGDIETIALKALEKERERRYRSAIDLADDIRRYLGSEPIEARPPSALYHFRRFVARNRRLVGLAAAVFIVLVAGIIGTSLALGRALRAEERALTEADKSAQVAGFLQAMLGGINPEVARGRDTALLREILDSTARRIGTDLADQPEVEASIRDTLGRTCQAIGLYAAAEEHLERALATRRRVLGDDHPDSLDSISNLGFLLKTQGKLADAEPLYREALDRSRRVHGNDHRSTLSSIMNLGALLQTQGKLAEAEPYYREALEGCRRVLGEDDVQAISSMSNMAILLQSQGRHDEAESYSRAAMQGMRRLHGDDHPGTLTAANNLGALLQKLGRLAEAEPYCREAFEGRRRMLGEDHLNTLNSMTVLGALYMAMDRLGEAEPLLASAVERARRSMPPGHWMTGTFLAKYATCLVALHRDEEAEAALVEAHRVLDAALGPGHEHTVKAANDLARLRERRGPAGPDAPAQPPLARDEP